MQFLHRLLSCHVICHSQDVPQVAVIASKFPFSLLLVWHCRAYRSNSLLACGLCPTLCSWMDDLKVSLRRLMVQVNMHGANVTSWRRPDGLDILHMRPDSPFNGTSPIL